MQFQERKHLNLHPPRKWKSLNLLDRLGGIVREEKKKRKKEEKIISNFFSISTQM